jgi:hypothetical protein
MGLRGGPDTKQNWQTDRRSQNQLELQLQLLKRFTLGLASVLLSFRITGGAEFVAFN